MSRRRLLIVDDEECIRQYIRMVAEECDFRVETVGAADDFLPSFASFSPDVVLLDLVLPNVDGVELLKGLGRLHCQVPIILMSGMDTRTLEAARRVGMDLGLAMRGGLCKPLSPQLLCESLHQAVGQERALEARELHRAIKNDELELHYQPLIHAQGREFLGVEALVRWKHPRRGLLPPSSFIPLAESSRQMNALTTWVMRRAFAQMQRWMKNGINITLALNISAQDLVRRRFPNRFAELLREYQVPASRIVLEVTESQAMSSVVLATEVLTRLRLQGMQLAVDDFGTGFSSLKLLNKLPFSEIKIDKSFVLEAVTDHSAKVITRSVIQLGHVLGLRVTAEGVENQVTWDLLESMGCDRLQGYAIGRPMPEKSLERWMDGWRMPSKRLP